jgi:hypothetical protein
MVRGFGAVPLAAVVWLGGCSIHPLPNDVTGISTYNIVRQIRCEARQAIFDFATDWLIRKSNDEEARQIGIEFKEGRRRISDFNYTLFKGQVRRLVEPFFSTGIAYNFQLQMSEIDNIDPMTDLLTLNGRNVFGTPVSGNADRTRQNIRTFTVTDTFGFLIRNIPDDPVHNNDYCTGYIVGPNYMYPVAGKIGVDRMIGDFVNLSLYGGLVGVPSSASNPTTADSKGPPTMVDQLQFTTTVALSATPKVTFAPVRTFVDASLGLKFQRQDIHTVTIGLAFLDKTGIGQIAALRSTIFAPGPIGQLVSARPTTDSEYAAVQAVNQLLTQQIFKPTINVSTIP